MADVVKLVAEVPLGWKKSSGQGVVIPPELENCTDCKKFSLYVNFDNMVNQKKNFQLI